MTAPFDPVVTTMRQLRGGPLLVRATIGLAAAVAIAATVAPAWDAPDGYVVVAVLGAVAAVLAPDSGAATVAAGAIVATWLAGSPGDVGPAVVVTASALLLGHLATALAAAMPVTAALDVAAALRWWRPTACIVAATTGVALLVAVLDTGTRGGAVAVTVAALAGLAAAAWWWSRPG